MNIDIDDAILRLNAESNFRLRDARGACVHVHWGDVWITQDGDSKDHVVTSGESFAISNSGMTYLSAIGEAGVSVLEKCREAAAAAQAAGEAVQLPAAPPPDAETRQPDAAGATLLNKTYPSVDELERNIARAKRLRAEYFADTLAAGWNALRRSFGALRRLG